MFAGKQGMRDCTQGYQPGSKTTTRLYLPSHQSSTDKPTYTYTETSAAISCVQPLFHPLSTPFSPIYEEALMDRQTVDTAESMSPAGDDGRVVLNP